jgi:hypothetical protein
MLNLKLAWKSSCNFCNNRRNKQTYNIETMLYLKFIRKEFAKVDEACEHITHRQCWTWSSFKNQILEQMNTQHINR